MAINIKRILNKKNPTGEEVGKAFLANTAAGYRRLLVTQNYSAETKGIFSQNELNLMKSRLKTSSDINAFNSYVSIDDYIAKEQGFASAYLQQANLGYYKLFQQLNSSIAAEDRIADSAMGPLVITHKQYNDYCNEIRKEERANTVTYFKFLGDIFFFYYEQYKKHPRKKNPISEAISISLKKVITNERILKKYAELHGKGHYITIDGVRSDECDRTEWVQNINRLIYGGYSRDALQNLIFESNEEPFIIKSYIDTLKNSEYITSDKTIPQIDNNFTWVNATAPEQLESEKVLDELNEYYAYLFVYVYVKGKTEKQLEEFQSEFPELYAALQKEVANIFPGEEYASMKNFDKPIATWGDLADRNVLNYKNRINNIRNHQIIEHVASQKSFMQGLFHGIAIIRDEDLDEFDVDENGYYIQNDMSVYALSGEIRELASNEDSVSFIESARKEDLIDSIREVYAYNTIIDLICEITGVDVSVFSMKQQTDEFEQQIISFNNLILLLYSRINVNNTLFDPRDRSERIEQAEKLFPLINLKMAVPTQTAKLNTLQYISDLQAFKINSPLIIEMLKKHEGD